MAFEKKTFAPDAIANARRLYEHTKTPLGQVAAALGITRGTLAARIIEWGWTPRATAGSGAKRKTRRARSVRKTRACTSSTEKHKPSLEPKSPRAAPRVPPRDGDRRASPDPEALAARVQRVVERELDAIDRILGTIGAADAAEAERSARTLASLARALKEVMRLAAPDEPAEPDDDDPMPRDLDEFRRELARRLEALAAGGTAAPAGDGG